MSDSQPVRRAPIPLARSAYPVPWRLIRGRPGRVTLVNRGEEVLDGVHLFLLGDGALLAGARGRVPPGGSVGFVVTAAEPQRNTVACVRWFRPDGAEYLWRVSF